MPRKTFTEYLNNDEIQTEVAREGDLVSCPETLDELSTKLVRRYIHKAKKDVKKREDSEYSDDNDTKAFKRKMYVGFAQHAKLHEEKIRHPEHKKAYVEPYENNGETAYKASNRHGNLKFFNKHGRESAYKHAGLRVGPRQIDERQDLSPTYRLAVNRRATKSPAVLHRKNNRMKGMFKKNKTQYVTQNNFRTRSKHDALHLTTRSKHQLTDRWRDQRIVRMQTVRKNKNVHEDAQYLKNRQLIHQAHAQAGREIGKGERDPELRRIHMHRSRKHAHAAKVLETIRKRRK